MPRKRDINLSHCGNAISRMWSPFGWVRNGVLARRETPRQGIRCLLPPNQIFPAAKWVVGTMKARERSVEMRTAARIGGGGRNYLIAFAMERIRSEANCYFLSAVRTILNGHDFSFSSSRLNSSADILALTSCHVSSNFSNALFFVVSETAGISDSFKL